jgi:hypothetical protein
MEESRERVAVGKFNLMHLNNDLLTATDRVSFRGSLN